MAPLSALVLLGFLPLEPVQRARSFYSHSAAGSVNFLLADRFKRSAEEVASIVLIGHLLSLLFLPLGLALARRF